MVTYGTCALAHILQNNHIITNKFEFIGVKGKTSLHVRIMDQEYVSHKYNYNMFHIFACQSSSILQKWCELVVCLPFSLLAVFVCRHVEYHSCWFSHFSISRRVAIYPIAKSLNLNITHTDTRMNAAHTSTPNSHTLRRKRHRVPRIQHPSPCDSYKKNTENIEIRSHV